MSETHTRIHTLDQTDHTHATLNHGDVSIPQTRTVPVVDIGALLHALSVGDESAATTSTIHEVGDALAEWGFVNLTGHTIKPALLDIAYAQARAVFALDEGQKCAYEDEVGGRQRGYTPLLMERAKHQSAGDLKEFWHVGRELETHHPDRVSGLMRSNLFPSEVPHFREALLELYREMDNLARVMLSVIERYFDLAPRALSQLAEGGDSVLRVLHYPDLEQIKPEPGSVRAAAHEDINLLTLLPAATQPGLELLTRSGEWLSVSPPPGAIVLDTGDMMNAITGGVMPATTHRVVNPTAPQAGGRLSLPFFMHPHPNAILERLVESADDARTHTRQVEGVGLTARQFLRRRLYENGVIDAP